MPEIASAEEEEMRLMIESRCFQLQDLQSVRLVSRQRMQVRSTCLRDALTNTMRAFSWTVKSSAGET